MMLISVILTETIGIGNHCLDTIKDADYIRRLRIVGIFFDSVSVLMERNGQVTQFFDSGIHENGGRSE